MMDEEKVYNFYTLTEEKLINRCRIKGISDLNKYYTLTDFYGDSIFNSLSDKAQVFAQLAFHAQNATLISNIVSFERNFPFLKRVLCDFNPNKFLLKYPVENRENSLNRIVEDLRYDSINNPNGLSWSINKSKPKNKDSIIKRYANMLLDAASFLENFSDRNEFLDNLKENYPNKNHKFLIRYFRKKIPHGFSIALTCDFLKEFDVAFSDLPKPDVHIKDTLIALFGYDDNYYNTEKKEYQCINDVQEITSIINNRLISESKSPITVYQLDRMIWLACTDNFFIDFSGNTKELYLQDIKNL